MTILEMTIRCDQEAVEPAEVVKGLWSCRSDAVLVKKNIKKPPELQRHLSR